MYGDQGSGPRGKVQRTSHWFPHSYALLDHRRTELQNSLVREN